MRTREDLLGKRLVFVILSFPSERSLMISGKYRNSEQRQPSPVCVLQEVKNFQPRRFQSALFLYLSHAFFGFALRFGLPFASAADLLE